MITVAFIDDHPILLSGLCHLMSGNDEFKVVGTGCDADAIHDIVEAHHPDVLVADFSMPGNVLEAIAKTGRDFPDTRILAFSATCSIEKAIAILEAGATGFALKGSSLDDLTDAIRQVNKGENYITPSFAMKVVTGLREKARRKETHKRIAFSPREDQVLRLLLTGQTNKEIADALEISEKTVKHYMSILMQKLNVRNRLEVVLAAQSLPQQQVEAPRAAALN
ncbi:response regulator transcription factor [uncultured Jannaschia sp.]|uniref:LuxR C-terminal-related transcriptional regulator n=1 Tax=Jannaschia halovivens TaxID=3388667 RepID=UPI002604BC3D|nr:response regulator transcription factor [uncultured Jannaschia sp.]